MKRIVKSTDHTLANWLGVFLAWLGVYLVFLHDLMDVRWLPVPNEQALSIIFGIAFLLWLPSATENRWESMRRVSRNSVIRAAADITAGLCAAISLNKVVGDAYLALLLATAFLLYRSFMLLFKGSSLELRIERGALLYLRNGRTLRRIGIGEIRGVDVAAAAGKPPTHIIVDPCSGPPLRIPLETFNLAEVREMVAEAGGPKAMAA